VESDRQVAARLLQEVLAGRLEPQAAEDRFPGLDGDDRSLHVAMHALQHYRQDSDIRAKDDRYAQLQTGELQRIAASLAIDEDVDPEIAAALEPLPGCLFRLLGRGNT
jgi:hypothetical protein